jgi:hypothetical protein
MRAVLGSLTAVLLFVGLASASTEDRSHTPQTERMKACNAEAHDKHLAGDERRHFMSDCLKNHAAPHDTTPHADKASQPKSNDGGSHGGQAEKMKVCNQEASVKNLHGDDRRHFMSECLKGEKKS